MEHVELRTSPDNSPVAIVRDGREWSVLPGSVRWYERVNWWESERRMPRGAGRVDVEIIRLQARLGRSAGSGLVTMELVRDARGGGWRVRGLPSAASSGIGKEAA